MDLDLNLQPKQIKAARYWLDEETEELLYGGGKMGGKSYLGCALIFGDALTYPGTLYFIGRHDLIDIKRFTIPSIYEVFEHWNILPMDYMKFNGQENFFHLTNGSKVFLLDCKQKPSDPDFHGFGSMQFTRGWIEEAGQIKDKAIINLMASVGRWKNTEYNLKRKILLTCNPNKGYTYKEFYIPWEKKELPKFKKYIQALPKDNKKAPQDYIDSLYRLPKNEKERLVFGNWHYDDDPTKLIDFDKIMDLWTNDHVQGSRKYLSCDIARFGGDKTVIMVWSGFRIVYIHTMAKNKVTEAADKIKDIKRQFGISSSDIVIDDDGVGGGVVDMMPNCVPFIANKKPVLTDSRQNYANLKSQCYFILAEKVNKGEIYIEIDDYSEQIIEELEQVKKDKEETDDKLRVVKKEHVKEMIGRSPDFSDAIMMRMYLGLQRRTGLSRVN